MAETNVRSLFPQLLANGYVPLPNKDKQCRLKRWSTIAVDEAQCLKWSRGTRWAAIGLRVEPPLLAWDLDVPDPELAARVRALMPECVLDALERHGNPPKTMFLLQLDGEPFDKLSTHRYLRDGEAFQVEVFGGKPANNGAQGRQIGAFGPHSYDDDGQVKRTYSWVGDRSPANVALPELPVMQRDQIGGVLEACETLFASWPGLMLDAVARRREGDGKHLQKYSLDETMSFADDKGVTYTLDELISEAKARAQLGEDFRITGSFLNEPGSKNSPRCRVRWSKRTGISVTDYHTGTTYRDSRGLPDIAGLDELALKFFTEG